MERNLILKRLMVRQKHTMKSPTKEKEETFSIQSMEKTFP